MQDPTTSFEFLSPQAAEYCKSCGLPHEYCKWGKRLEACRPGLIAARPDLATEFFEDFEAPAPSGAAEALEGLVLGEGGEVVKKKKKKKKKKPKEDEGGAEGGADSGGPPAPRQKKVQHAPLPLAAAAVVAAAADPLLHITGRKGRRKGHCRSQLRLSKRRASAP